MNKTVKFLLGGVGIAVAVAGLAYYNAIQNLTYKFGGIKSIKPFGNNGMKANVAIEFFNPSKFSYPVPMLAFDIYANGQYVGTAQSYTIQIIAPGTTYIYADVTGTIETNLQLLSSYYLGEFTNIDLTFVGGARLGKILLPLDFQFSA